MRPTGSEQKAHSNKKSPKKNRSVAGRPRGPWSKGVPSCFRGRVWPRPHAQSSSARPGYLAQAALRPRLAGACDAAEPWQLQASAAQVRHVSGFRPERGFWFRLCVGLIFNKPGKCTGKEQKMHLKSHPDNLERLHAGKQHAVTFPVAAPEKSNARSWR